MLFLNQLLANVILKKVHKDKIKTFEITCMFIIILSIIIRWIIEGGFDGVEMTLGILITLFSVVINSITYIMDIKLCSDYHPYYINLFTGVFLVIFCPLLLSIKNEKFNVLFSMHIFLIILSACYFMSNYILMKNTWYGDAMLYSPYNNITIIMLLLCAKFIFGNEIVFIDIILMFLIFIISMFRYYSYKKM